MQWPERPATGNGSNVAEVACEAKVRFIGALADDLNTAEARAAIFEMVRFVNQRADAGSFYSSDQAAVLDTLREFDRVFAVLEDHDAEWMKFTLEWAEREGRLGEASPEVRASLEFSDEQVQALVDERTQAKRTRNFARADEIRNLLTSKGILIEDSKDGVRWKRK